MAVAVTALFSTVAHSNVQIASTRLWPSKEYTRLTIESAAPIRYTLFTVPDPHRVVLDLEGVAPGPQVDALPGKLPSDDPYIKSIRFGRFKPGVLRLVLDLKDEARPEAFTLGERGLAGTVLMIEPTGPETYAVIETAIGTVTARVPGRLLGHAGDRVALAWRAEDAHLFDAATERRLA